MTDEGGVMNYEFSDPEDWVVEENQQDLKERTKTYALRIIRLYGALPGTTEAQVIGKQLLRSGTSVGANYREKPSELALPRNSSQSVVYAYRNWKRPPIG